MNDPLRWFAPVASVPAEAIRWACVLEATAPKPGNVFPGRPFGNLSYMDFVAGAEIASECLVGDGRVSQRMLDAVMRVSSRCNTNVNLGIILLLGPIVAADQSMGRESSAARTASAWKDAIVGVLQEFDDFDGRNVFGAITSASAGGLGQVETLDVQSEHESIDLLEAMRMAADRDRVALQYAGGFTDLLDHVVPLLSDCIEQCGDILQGICRAHVQLLASSPDSLIARKNGREQAERIQTLAGSIDLDDPRQVARLDASLRDSQHRLNPGTTADLIAAGLYLLLRNASIDFASSLNQDSDL